MKARKALAIICYTICIAAFVAAVVVSYMAYRQTITYTLGFLIFVPIWIGSFWFLNFFNDLSRRTVGEKTKYIIKKRLRRVLSITAHVISILLLGFWVYIYMFDILPSESESANRNGDPLPDTAIVRGTELTK